MSCQAQWNKVAIGVVCPSLGLCSPGKGVRVASRQDAVAAEIPRLRRYAWALTGDDGGKTT